MDQNSSAIPPVLFYQLNIVYEALAKCPQLLQQGRSFGVQVGLTPKAIDLLLQEYGPDHSFVLDNVRRLPKH